MLHKTTLLLCLSWLLSISLSAQNNYDIVPAPQAMNPLSGQFVISTDKIIYLPLNRRSWLQTYLKDKKGVSLQANARKTTAPAKAHSINYIKLSETVLGPEAYSLHITADQITIQASTDAGFFYADQTLIQLIELNNSGNGKIVVPCVRINDSPRFKWRGMHLDESRHFMGKAFVKKYIDYLAALKMNVFHWHLTDAQGWRIEIKKYPKLTSIGAWRPDRSGILFEDADTARVGETMSYGGFYTQNEIKSIVAYARSRHVTIIPEIEMPGHSTAALVAYPEYSCTGGPFAMPGGAKNSPYPNFCVGNDAAFHFLEEILSEVMNLFPSKYIHIGGDEVERDQWQKCPKCQARKQALGLKDEAALQVYFTKRIEDFLHKKGRKLMGWDEIMEGGGLSTSAAVMVWRGENLVNEATAAGHVVVITHNYYLNNNQGNPQFEPVGSGYLPIEQVYNYEPVPAGLSAAQKKLIRGVEGCLWTENVNDARRAEYMLFPRLLALAEVAWTPVEQRNWERFAPKLPHWIEILTGKGINSSTSIYDPVIEMQPDSARFGMLCSIQQQVAYGQIHYTLDGTAPGLNSPTYQSPFALQNRSEIRATAFNKGVVISKTLAVSYHPTLASGKSFALKYQPKPQYNGNRPAALTDGIQGGDDFHDGNWCGFYGDDLDITIDLQTVKSISQINMGWMEATNSWIYLPTQITVEFSEDAMHFEKAYSGTAADLRALTIARKKALSIPVMGKKARYVRIYAQNPGQHPLYPDGKCWLFVDEIGVE